jgi:putative acyl-CoA dehydrogenase
MIGDMAAATFRVTDWTWRSTMNSPEPSAPPFGRTHEVTNQSPPLCDYDAFAADAALAAAVVREGADWHAGTLSDEGIALTQPGVLALAELANRHTPELRTHSPRGERIDALEFHPAWHELVRQLRQAGCHALPFEADARAGSMAARCASYFLHGQLESGSLCPITMSFASIPVLRRESALFASIAGPLLSREHDPRDIPLSAGKRSMMIGMGMTEKQGGSDVRSNRTRAHALGAGGRGGEYRLIGHKWFFSAPQCDAHLVLARTSDEGGVSCFYVPRFAPGAQKNAVQIQRLKDKLGNRSNASSEVEFLDAYGVMIGDEGRGVPTIIEMANYTRLDCVIGSAALMRAALAEAIHHARHRRAFGATLADQPLMRNVLADLALESEAATLLFMRLAGAFEQSASKDAAPLERAWRRIVTPAAKFWVCKRALEFTGEAMEVWGGNGYVETGPMARFYREAPVNSIWEGSGNVMCLDVLRAFEREQDDAHALLDDWRGDASAHPALARTLKSLLDSLTGDPAAREASARRVAQQLALCAQAVLMTRHAPSDVADAFVETRLGDARGETGRVYGTLPARFDHAGIVARAFTP